MLKVEVENGGLLLEVQRLGLNRNGVGMWLRIYNIAMFINVHGESSYVFLTSVPPFY